MQVPSYLGGMVLYSVYFNKEHHLYIKCLSVTCSCVYLSPICIYLNSESTNA